MKKIRFLAALTALLLPLSSLAAQGADKHSQSQLDAKKAEGAVKTVQEAAAKGAATGAGSADASRGAANAQFGEISGAGGVVMAPQGSQQLAKSRDFSDKGTKRAQSAAADNDKVSANLTAGKSTTVVPVPEKNTDSNRWNPTIAGVKGGIYGGLLGLIFGGATGMVLFATIGFVVGYGMHKLNN